MHFNDFSLATKRMSSQTPLCAQQHKFSAKLVIMQFLNCIFFNKY